jgi:hypothetical protein
VSIGRDAACPDALPGTHRGIIEGTGLAASVPARHERERDEHGPREEMMAAFAAALVVALAFFGMATIALGGLTPLTPFAALAAIVLYVRVWRIWSRSGFPAAAPSIASADLPPLDVSEDLLDLLRDARLRAGRLLSEHGTVEPFVAWHDAAGDSHGAVVQVPDGTAPLARARERARAVDPSAPRVVLAVLGRAVIDGRRRHIVFYEAAERGFRSRTTGFVQTYRPRRLAVFGARLEAKPIYIGDGAHALRFADEASTLTR